MELEVFGEVQNQLDDKGRVTMSRRFQPLFCTGGILTRAFNGKSLVFYPTSIWNAFQQRLKDIKTRIIDQDPAFFLKAELATGNMNRFMSCGVNLPGLDGQNRLTIPPTLRHWAKLDKEVSLIGMGDTIEIWDTDTWHAFNEEQMTVEALERSLSALSARPLSAN
jgi:MraZ protein